MLRRVRLLPFLFAILLIGAVAGLLGRSWFDVSARHQLEEMGLQVLELQDFRAGLPPVTSRQDGTVLANFERVLARPGDDARRLACRIRNLAGLSIVDPASVVNVSELTAYRNVRFLEISGPCRILGREAWSQFPCLEKLVIRHNLDEGDKLARELCGCSALRSLHLSNTSLTNDGVAPLLQKLRLTELTLHNNDIGPESFAMFGDHVTLNTLDVSRSWDFYMDRSDILPGRASGPSGVMRSMDERFLGEFRRFGNVRFPPHLDVVATAVFPHELKWLDCSGWRFSPSVLGRLANLPSLEYLNLSGHPLTPAELRVLAGFKALRCLGLADTPTDDECIGPLAAISGLEALDVRGTRITAEGIESLCREMNLERLYLDVGSEGATFALKDLERIMRSYGRVELFVQCELHLKGRVRDLAVRLPNRIQEIDPTLATCVGEAPQQIEDVSHLVIEDTQ